MTNGSSGGVVGGSETGGNDLFPGMMDPDRIGQVGRPALDLKSLL